MNEALLWKGVIGVLYYQNIQVGFEIIFAIQIPL